MRNIMYTILFLLTISPALAGNGRPIAYTVNGQAYEGYYISPAETAPLVFIIHDWDGLTGYEIERAGMLAELGYAVFALDLFGAGVRPTELEDKRRLTGELYKNRQKMRSLMKGAMAAAGKQGADLNNAVAVGYCFGGAAVLEWARSEKTLRPLSHSTGGSRHRKNRDMQTQKEPCWSFTARQTPQYPCQTLQISHRPSKLRVLIMK